MTTLKATLRNTSNNLSVKFNTTQNDVTLKNTTIARNRLDQLNDVVESDDAKTKGSLLVYESSTDTYVLKSILSYDENIQAYKLDGGSQF